MGLTGSMGLSHHSSGGISPSTVTPATTAGGLLGRVVWTCAVYVAWDVHTGLAHCCSLRIRHACTEGASVSFLLQLLGPTHPQGSASSLTSLTTAFAACRVPAWRAPELQHHRQQQPGRRLHRSTQRRQLPGGSDCGGCAGDGQHHVHQHQLGGQHRRQLHQPGGLLVSPGHDGQILCGTPGGCRAWHSLGSSAGLWCR